MQVVRRMNALLTDLTNRRHAALGSQRRRLTAVIATSFPDFEDQLEASAEDREGLGATRNRQAVAKPEPQSLVRA